MKRIAILGSTGSIGTQTIEVIEEHPELFKAEILSANNNSELLIEQAKRLKPNTVVIANEDKYQQVQDALFKDDIKVFAGIDAVNQIVENENVDIVVTALVGFAGLQSTYNAVKAGKNIALANKETLVVAGDIIMKEAKMKNVDIIPVDSEHSAIFQCLVGEFANPIEKIILTASGGPFREKSKDYIRKADARKALKHPNWDMGAKISIDSATMMNKGLEVIEAKWLFGLKKDQIDVIVHPQSIIHSLVQFNDGSLKAQLGLPDMKLPIQYAMGFPKRIENNFKRFNFADYPELNFQKPDFDKFPNLELAYKSLEIEGNAPAILNAANEVAVEMYLKNKISFYDISKYIELSLEKISFIKNPNLEDYINTDEETRKYLINIIK